MNPLPTGTVTFLFTDVEGSTRLWAERPEAMRAALARHDAAVREAIEAGGGHVFKTVGDAFCAVFATADGALAAALAVQRALVPAADDAAAPIRVRCALHTGAAELRDGDYFGTTLNRLARLLGAAHGGQTVLSGVTRDLLQAPPPAGSTLRDLGTHRLRDVAEPERVFQLVHPALPADFPPLASLGGAPHNLPVEPNPFVGRRAESEAVAALLGRAAVVTLVGPGGAGKTRLALRVAADHLPDFPDGVWLVELAALTDPALVPQAVATVLHVREVPGTPVLDTLIDHLRSRRLMVVLDNGEHVVDACARLAEAVVRACPRVAILVTSREALAIAAEAVFHVPPLGVPVGISANAGDATAAVRDVLDSEAGQLFVTRAADTAPAFALTAANAAAVAGICRRLDGLALAIELAAARVRLLSPEQIAARLDDHLRLLTSGRRDADPRQQTMRGAIDWSYRLLGPSERTLLNRLAVFAGGWTLEMAEALCAGSAIADWEVLDLLAGLVDKSLVATAGEGGVQRYRLFETIRQYALEQLAASGEADALRAAHLAWCADFACGAEAHLHGPDQGAWLDRIDAEHDNCRAALAWAATSGAAEPGLRLAAALWPFWYMRGHLGEGRRSLGALLGLDAAAAASPAVRGRATKALGALAYYQGDYPTARAAWEEGLALARAADSPADVGKLLNNLGLLLRAVGDYAASRRCFDECLAVMRGLGDRGGEARALRNLAQVAYEEGRLAESKALIDACLTLHRALGDTHAVAEALCNLAGIEFSRGDYAAADAHALESLRLYEAAGAAYGVAEAMEVLARCAGEAGDLPRARALGEDRLAILRGLGDKHGIANAQTGLALVHLRAGDLDRAAAAIDEGLALAREVAYQPAVAEALLHDSQLALAQGDLARAAADLREALGIGRDLRSDWHVARTVERLIALAAARGDAQAVLTLAAAADALRARGHTPRPPAIAAEIAAHCAAARTTIDATNAAACTSAGAALDASGALGYALDWLR